MEGKRGEPRKETMWSSGPHWKGEIWADLNEARESAVNIWGKSFPDQGLDRAEALSEAGSVPGVWIKNWWARVRRKGVCCKDSDLSLNILKDLLWLLCGEESVGGQAEQEESYCSDPGGSTDRELEYIYMLYMYIRTCIICTYAHIYIYVHDTCIYYIYVKMWKIVLKEQYIK